MLETQDMDKKVQEILRKLNREAELLQEYKESRAFYGKVKMLLERASKREAQGFVSSTGPVRSVGLGPTNSQGHRIWENHPSVDSPLSCPPQLFSSFGYQQRARNVTGLQRPNRPPGLGLLSQGEAQSSDTSHVNLEPGAGAHVSQSQQSDYENQGLSFAFREPRSSPEQRPVVRTGSVRLPKINMMSFDCDIMKWTQSWDKFERNIDKNTTLSDVSKF